MKRPDKWAKATMERAAQKAAVSALQKYIPYSTGSLALAQKSPEPPYKRRFNPQWIYSIRENHALINNAIEEKVSQTFRRGFDEWEKSYEAKCPKCDEEFPDETEFRKQAGGEIPEDVDIDFSTSRICPECGDKVKFETPSQEVKERAQDFFSLANGRELGAEHLQPVAEAGIGQQFISVCKEVGWDIESFDDGWMLFDRAYKLDEGGRIIDFDLRGVHRGPPDLMNFIADEHGRFGGEAWVCIKCRAEDESYAPQSEPEPCGTCGSKTYEAYAYSTDEPMGDTPDRYFIRGEFVQASQYEPSKFHGFSPIITLYDEARAIEKMDEWYREAYEQRRAPRGALVVRSSNADATRTFNREQLEKLNSDPNHIPTLMDDSDGGGSDPIKFEELLENPANMQMMEMREWIKDRISAKYGVTEIMMSGSPENSGLSQSMEVQVSNRAADRLRGIFNDIFIPAFLGQIGTPGWERNVAQIEEEDEKAEAERTQRQLQIAQAAAQLGLQVEWKEDNEAYVKPGEVDVEGPEGEGMGPESEPGDAFVEGVGGGAEDQPQLDGVNAEGGAPASDPRPAEDEGAFGRSAENADPDAFGALAKDAREGEELEVYNDDVGIWESAEMVRDLGTAIHCKTETTGTDFYVGENGVIEA